MGAILSKDAASGSLLEVLGARANQKFVDRNNLYGYLFLGRVCEHAGAGPCGITFRRIILPH